MSPEAQRIAIAEACGWDVRLSPAHGCMVLTVGKEGFAAATGNQKQTEAILALAKVPDYPNDLNAMHEAEKTLTGEQCIKYADELNRATKCFKHITPVIMCMATAEQRAEAFLKTLGLWKS